MSEWIESIGGWTKIGIFSVPFALLALLGVAWFFMRGTVRSRIRMQKQLEDDRDINEWLIIFNWSRKVLYVPTILAALVAFAILLVTDTPARTIGGIWLGIFFLNFLVDEYEMSLKVIFIGILFLVALGLWLYLLGMLVPFLKSFLHLGFAIEAPGYLILSLIGIFAVLVAWFKGLFYYVAITPNYLNIQVGPTETGEQVSREEFSSRVDTGDFLERLLGFGRIIITFADQRRQPMVFLVWRIGTKATALESIRGKLAVDRYQPGGGTHPDVL